MTGDQSDSTQLIVGQVFSPDAGPREMPIVVRIQENQIDLDLCGCIQGDELLTWTFTYTVS